VIGLAKKQVTIPDEIKAYVGEITPDGIEITDQNLRSAVNTYVGNARRRLGKNATQAKIFEDFKIEYLYKSLKSTSNLKSGVIDNITAPEKKQEEIRNTPINDELDDGYSPQEKEFVQRRLSEYSGDYKLERAADVTLARQTILYEMWMDRLNKRVSREPKNFDELIKQIQTLNMLILKNQEALNALKKQVDNPRNNKPEETKNDIIDILNAIDKPIADLEQDIVQEEEEEERMLKAKSKRS
jgi:flagellar biosynthesis chaperone FliJ